MTAVIITGIVNSPDTIFKGNGYSANKTQTSGALLKTCEPPSPQKYTSSRENIQTRTLSGGGDLLHFLHHLSRLLATRLGDALAEHKFIALTVVVVWGFALTESFRGGVGVGRRSLNTGEV